MRRKFALALVAVSIVFFAAGSFSAQQPTRPAYALALSGRFAGAGFNGTAKDPDGTIWAIGDVDSRTTLSTTNDALQPGPAGNGDAFIEHLRADGTVLYLSYLGGSGLESGKGICIDADGFLYVSGETGSANFPITTGPGLSGTSDAFVTKLTPDGRSIVYSRLFGGSGYDYASVIGVDAAGKAHIAGTTGSFDMPVTSDAARPSRNDVNHDDAFYARLSADGGTIEYATYMGGSDEDEALGISVDQSGDAYVVGSTQSTDFTLRRALKSQFPSSAGSQGWLARFTDSGLDYSTYLGGSSSDAALAVAVSSDAVFVSGFTTSSDFPGAAASAKSAAAFVAKLTLEGSAVLQSTLLDGSGAESARALAVEQDDTVHVAGATSSSDFPTTADAIQKPASGQFATYVFFAVVPMADGTSGSPTYASVVGGESSGMLQEANAIALDAAGGAFIVGLAEDQNFPAVNTPPPPSQTAFAAIMHFVPGSLTRNDVDGEVVVYAHDASTIAGNWQLVADPNAAGGARLWNPDMGAAKISTPFASPTTYFDVAFQAQADKPYHIWLRMKADDDSWQNDSVWVQFSDSVDSSGDALWRTGTTSGTYVSLERCTGCGEQSWGWGDNGYGAPGVNVSFASTGTHTIRIQQREDGVSIDQIVLSSARYLTSAPGASKVDTTVLTQSTGAQGSTTPPNTLPNGWTDADVGTTGAAGSASYASGTFTVQGAGSDVWGTSDAFNYVYMPLTTDGKIIAHVATVSDQAAWVKAGVMIRSSLSPSAAQAFMLVSSAKGVAFQRRLGDGDTSVSTSGTASTAPHWVELVRTSSVIQGWESADGVNWTFIGSDTFTMPQTVLIGLAVSSHVDGTLATATFDNVLTQALPSGWGDNDIGNVPFAGFANDSNGTFTVTGSGADIWGTADAFHYAWHLMNGDGAIVARVATIPTDVSPWVKAGVMIRNSFDPGSAHAFVLVSSSKGVAFQRRDAAGGASVSTLGSASTAPHWVKLVRSGDLFTAYESLDGAAWTEIGSDTIPMAQSIYIGLAVTSHTTTASATCTFDNVTITSGS